jgi:DNA polymerase elongation subunit (family B)
MKLLLLDIESAPNLVHVWGLWNQNIHISQIMDSSYVMCFAAKWVGEDEVFFDSVHQSKPKAMLKKIHKLLEEADAVIHWNGARFDIPTLNKEFIIHQMKPPATYKQIDLLLTSRSRFRFASNKLDYVAQALGIGKKHKHAGHELWVKCMAGDDEAWKNMETYNKQDVTLLEGVYEIFRPWIRNHPNVGLYNSDESVGCPVCGSSKLTRRGFSFTSVGKYQRYQCGSCGHWSRGRTAIDAPVQLITDKT